VVDGPIEEYVSDERTAVCADRLRVGSLNVMSLWCFCAKAAGCAAPLTGGSATPNCHRASDDE
jgi:hypothetical protein